MFAKAYYPWVKARADAVSEGEVLKFDIRYVYAALISLASTGFVALWALSTFVIPDVNGWQALISLFIAAAMFGYTTDFMVSQYVDAKRAKEAAAAASG
ncbi:MAG: hypothetical protein PHG80_12465 [Methanoregulaceae archaeon]|nr:hypothetical protein [Methanoregulaceae archaeon]